MARALLLLGRVGRKDAGVPLPDQRAAQGKPLINRQMENAA
jgi:hypothetical protein